MPNHVTTKMTVTGPSDKLATFRMKHIQVKVEANVLDDGGQYQFDLGSVVPRPAVLEGTHSGGPLDPEDERYLRNKQAMEETGFANWYDWSLEKWGTKWNSYEFRWVLQEPEQLVFTFETAWSTPHPVIERLIEMYPELEFSTMSFDEMWNWAEVGSTLPTREFHTVGVKPDPTMYKAVYGTEPDLTPYVEGTIQ